MRLSADVTASLLGSTLFGGMYPARTTTQMQTLVLQARHRRAQRGRRRLKCSENRYVASACASWQHGSRFFGRSLGEFAQRVGHDGHAGVPTERVERAVLPRECGQK